MTLFPIDVHAIDFEGKVDLLVGGSPCQSFSQVGTQMGLDDTRGTLFYEFARIVKETNPKVFIYENVRNMLKHDHGNTWKVIKSVFDYLDYNIDFNVLGYIGPPLEPTFIIYGTKPSA